MRTNRLLMVVATAATLCCPISEAKAFIMSLADTSATSGGGVVVDTGVVARGSSGIEAAARGASPREKSELTAVLSSSLGTVAPACAALIVSASGNDDAVPGVFILTSYVIGPSIGHFYAGRAGRAFMGIAIRGVTLVGLMVAALGAEDNGNNLGALGIGCLVVGGGSVLFDIVDAPHSARVHNMKVRRPLAIIPTAVGGAPGVRVDVGM